MCQLRVHRPQRFGLWHCMRCGWRVAAHPVLMPEAGRHVFPASQKTRHRPTGHISPLRHSQPAVRAPAKLPASWCRPTPRGADKKRQSDFCRLSHSPRFCRRPSCQPGPADLSGFAQNQHRAAKMPRQIRPDRQSHRHQKQSAIPTGQCQWPEYHRAIVPAPPLICWTHPPPQRTDRVGGPPVTSCRKAAAYAMAQHDHHSQ